MKRKKLRLIPAVLALALLYACGQNAATTGENPGELPENEQGVSAMSENQSANPNLATRVTESEDHYIFQLNENVTREKAYYSTRFGIEIAADLYRPADLDPANVHAGIVIGPPFGGVKEQGPGVYANELASRGFVALAFDPAYHGYSGGEPRYTGSSSTYIEDFCAGVDYLGSLSYIDRNKIGVLGICGSGGFAISAASMDTRIKAVVTSALYDIAGNMNELSGEARRGMLEQMAAMRWKKVDTGEDAWLKSYPDAPVSEVPENLTGDMAEFFEFYGMERGWHPTALGNVTGETMPDLMTLPTTGHIGDMETPLLMVTGDIAHSRAFTETIFERASEPKQMIVVENARHIDLYDDVSKIPFDEVETFFRDVMGE